MYSTARSFWAIIEPNRRLNHFQPTFNGRICMLNVGPKVHCAPPPTVGQQVCITSQGKKSNFCPKALRKEFSRPNMRQKCGNSPYSVHQWIRNWILPHFDPKMGSLGLLEAKIIPKWRNPGSYCHCCDLLWWFSGLWWCMSGWWW